MSIYLVALTYYVWITCDRQAALATLFSSPNEGPRTYTGIKIPDGTTLVTMIKLIFDTIIIMCEQRIKL